MIKLTGLQIMVISEIDKLVNELKVVNDQIINPGMPTKIEVDTSINTFRFVQEKQTILIERIEKWTRTLSESITTNIRS